VSTTVQASAESVHGGVPPLRAGQGHDFFWRRLHSLTGIVPVGLFLIEHFISNSEAIHGAAAYNATVRFLTSLPFRIWLEFIGIFIPLAFHALYGIYIWWRGEGNVSEYSWAGNWMYTLQRWTGIIVFAYVIYHLWTLRFAGGNFMGAMGNDPNIAFDEVRKQLANPIAIVAYMFGIVAASWHLGYGVFLFCAKWGIVTGTKARKRMQLVGVALSVLLIVLGLVSEFAFVAASHNNEQSRMERMDSRPIAQPAQATR